MSRADIDLEDTNQSEHRQASVQQSGRGRRANKVNEIENPLGSFLQKRMERLGINQKEFARRLDTSRDKVRRLIFTRAIEIQSSLAERIIEVLGLSDIEREEFYRLLVIDKHLEPLTLTLPEEGTNTITSTGSGDVWLSLPTASATVDLSVQNQEISQQKHSSERGRKATEAGTQIGRFLEGHLQTKGMKRSDLARAAHLDPATVTRLIEGKTAIRSDTQERICQVLGLDEVARREFDMLIVQGRRADISVHKFSRIDLDELTEDLQKLQGFYEKGYAEYVLAEADRFYFFLKKVGFSKKENRAIDLQWRFGMLRGSANEAAVRWDERVLPTISFYNQLEEEINLRGIPPEQAKIYIAYIKARRAPLYRQLEKYQASLDEFTDALNVYSHYNEPPPEARRLIVELYYSRGHVYAVQGRKNKWERDIQLARMWAEAEKDEKRRRELVGLVVYTQGEGFKRLAFNEHESFSKETREEFAQKGLDLFKVSHMDESSWVGHRILNGVAQVQCLALIDPEVALKEAEILKAEAEQRYRSIVQKIDRIINYAHQRMQ